MKRASMLLPLVLSTTVAFAQNRPERLDLFQDQGFGMFIHWSLDSQLGPVIRHSMAGTGEPCLRRFIFDLAPRSVHTHKACPAYAHRPMQPEHGEAAGWQALGRAAVLRHPC